jgi:hypothetical protein
VVEEALRPHILHLKQIMGHAARDIHDPQKLVRCKNPVCRWINRMLREMPPSSLKTPPLSYLKGGCIFMYSNGLDKSHVGAISRWCRENLGTGPKKTFALMPFLDSPAFPYALTLVLLALNRKAWARSDIFGPGKLTLSEPNLLEVAFQYLIGDRQFEMLESEDGLFSQETEGELVDTLRDAIFDLEKTMFCRRMSVRDTCEPLIWGKDCGPHQDGVEIWKFAREVDATDDDFQPIEDDDWLNELYKVSPWLNIHDNQR